MPTAFRKRKLTAHQRVEIVNRVREGYTHSHLATVYGVSRARIGQVAAATDEEIEKWVHIANLPPLDDEPSQE